MSATRSSTGSNLQKTQAFYDDANVVLRTGLIIALLWPAFAVLAALLMTPENATTIVPIIELSPLVPMVVFFLGNPFKYFLFVQDSDIKAGARWVAGFIGVELAIGIYFAIIPIHNAPHLVPLLILTAFALFFLRVAQIARWLTILLIILLIGITLIFIVGGRKKVETAFKRPSTPSYKPRIVERRAYRPAARPAPNNAPFVCPGMENQVVDYSLGYQGGDINITNYGSGCFGPVEELPHVPGDNMCGQPYPAPNHTILPASLWNLRIQVVRQDQFGNWIAVRTTPLTYWTYASESKINYIGPTFRLEGRHAPGGGITFRPGPSSACETPASSNVTATTVSATPTAPPPTSGPVAATKDADVLHFGFWPCQRPAAATFCTGFVENEISRPAYEGVLPSDVKDNLGNDYAFEAFTINGSSCLGIRGGCWPSIGAKNSQRIQFQVDGVVPQATALVLFIHLTTGAVLLPGFGNTHTQDFSITIPIASAP